MSTHNICFYGEIRKLSQNYHQILLLNNSPGQVWYSIISKGKYCDIAQANSIYPVQMSQNVAFDQGLHYLPSIQQFLDTSTGSKMDLFKF